MPKDDIERIKSCSNQERREDTQRTYNPSEENAQRHRRYSMIKDRCWFNSHIESFLTEQSLLVATCRVISGGDDICKRHQSSRHDKEIVAARVSRIRLCLTRLPYQATFRARERGSTSLLISAHAAQTIVRISAPYRGGMKMVHLPANCISPISSSRLHFFRAKGLRQASLSFRAKGP